MFNNCCYKIILALVGCFLLQPSGAMSQVTDKHIKCYDSGDFGGDASAYNLYKVPVSVRVIGVDSNLALHQAVCNAVKTTKEEGSTWSNPLVRIAYLVAGKHHRRNLRPNQCMFIAGLRFCARMTIPVKGKNVYGNNTGVEGDGAGMKPQLCAYVDPMDGGDTKANEGRYHHKTDVSTFYDNLPVWAKAALGPVGAIVGSIKSVKNHIVVKTLGCVDRPMAVGPPAWTNDAWKSQYLPPPSINYANTSTFGEPKIRLDFCKQNITGVPGASEERVLCEFEKDFALGEYKRDPTTHELILLPSIRYESPPIILNPEGTATNFADEVVTSASLPAPDGREFEARISVEMPDSVCVYKTKESNGRTVDIIQGCLPRPGYMERPEITVIPNPVPLADAALQGGGIFGIKLRVKFPNLPGQIELEYLGDEYVGSPPPPPPPIPAGFGVGDPVDNCKILHQVTFCARVGAVEIKENLDPITNNPDGTFTAKASLCLEGYDTAPLVATTPYYTVNILTFGHDGKPLYDPPLITIDPITGLAAHNPKALPKFKVSQASDVIESRDTNGDGIPNTEPVNNWVLLGNAFNNVTAHTELAGGVVTTPTVTLPVDSYHYNPPMSDFVQTDPGYLSVYQFLSPPQQRPVDANDAYFVGGPNDYDYNGDGNINAKDDAKILRPMTAAELGLCANIEFQIAYTEVVATEPAQVFPSAAALANVNWESDTHITETFVSTVKDCKEVKVRAWGAGGAGSTNVGTANDFSGGSGGFIEADYDLLALNLINAPIPVSVGIGGDFFFDTSVAAAGEIQNGADGYSSSFGISSASIVAPGGGGLSKIVAGPGTCTSPACTVIRAYPGLPGNPTKPHGSKCRNDEGVAIGASPPDGIGGYVTTLSETYQQCNKSDDDFEPDLFKSDLRGNPGSSLGQYHHRSNLIFGTQAVAPPGVPIPFPPGRTFGAGGCAGEKGCDDSPGLGTIFDPKHERNGHVAPGALGRVEVSCILKNQLAPFAPTTTLP